MNALTAFPFDAHIRYVPVRARGGAHPEQPRSLREGGRTTSPTPYVQPTQEADAEKGEHGADYHARTENQNTPVPAPAPHPGFARTIVDPGLLGAGDSTQNNEAHALRRSTRCGRERDDGRVDKHHLHARPDGGRKVVIDNPEKTPHRVSSTRHPDRVAGTCPALLTRGAASPDAVARVDM